MKDKDQYIASYQAALKLPLSREKMQALRAIGVDMLLNREGHWQESLNDAIKWSDLHKVHFLIDAYVGYEGIMGWAQRPPVDPFALLAPEYMKILIAIKSSFEDKDFSRLNGMANGIFEFSENLIAQDPRWRYLKNGRPMGS